MATPGITIRDEQLKEMAEASGGQRQVLNCADGDDWIEVCLIDAEGLPITGEAYRIQLPDWSIHTGVLDADGCVRYEGIPSGACGINFPGLDGREWRPL